MLDDRKIKILYVIIDGYIKVAEPIGSRTISKHYDLGISSATIRNEMSDLEELGYLTKPHTSAGRVPSDKAYRFYVNNIINKNIFETDLKQKNDVKRVLIKESNEIDELMQNSAKVLSAITSYTALAITPQIKDMAIKHIQLVPISDKEILIVLVGSSGIVKNILVDMKESLSKDQIYIISNFLNYKISGNTILDLENAIKPSIFKEMFEYKDMIDKIILSISKSFEDYSDLEIFFDGVNKIFDFPEYKDTEKAKSFVSFIEDKEQLMDVLFNDTLYDTLNKGIEVTIGNENIYDTLKDSSLLTTTYKLGDMVIGKIGVIGPTRMDYLMVINSLKIFSENLTEILEKILKE